MLIRSFSCCAPALAALASLIAAGVTDPSHAEAPLVLNSYTAPPFSREDGTGQLDQIVKLAFERAGVGLRLRYIPGKRGLGYANDGVHDGHYLRGAVVTEEYPNLRPIPEPLARAYYHAIVKEPSIAIDGWKSLGDYTVGYPLSYAVFEPHAETFGRAVPVTSVGSLLKMVDAGRIDVALMDGPTFRRASKELGLTGLRALMPPLAAQDLFIMMHRKHESLLTRLAAALRSLRKDGTIARICPDCEQDP